MTARDLGIRDREIAALAARALAAGWEIRRTASNHFAWRAPEGRALIVSAGTPSDWRSARNLRARLRRAGLDV